MLHINAKKYKTFSIDDQITEVHLNDHLGGFDLNFRSTVLDRLSELVPDRPLTVTSEYIVNQQIKNNYSNFNFALCVDNHNRLIDRFREYNIHPDLKFKNFVCSFNGSPHVSRKLLVSIIKKLDWFNSEYCSKNFQFDSAIIDGHLGDFLLPDQHRFYNKFFMSSDSDNFFNTINSFGHVQYNHKQNIYNLEDKLTKSFLHIVSETMATSYYPFVTEKFLYSIVTRGLFLAYAQPGWHDYVEKYYGFKTYTKLFDYRFDTIQNPVERLVELMCMISKFSKLSVQDWHDLYLMEQDTIEYNYDHYFSNRYIEHLKIHGN
jgi:hypothetical protein